MEIIQQTTVLFSLIEQQNYIYSTPCFGVSGYLHTNMTIKQAGPTSSQEEEEENFMPEENITPFLCTTRFKHAKI